MHFVQSDGGIGHEARLAAGKRPKRAYGNAAASSASRTKYNDIAAVAGSGDL